MIVDIKYKTVSYSKVSTLDLPRDLCLQIDHFLMSFSSPLILDGTLAGSGTFIKCGRVYGILTAHHVVHNPRDSSRAFDFSAGSKQQLSLSITDKRSHSFTIPMSVLDSIDVGIPKGANVGPDLSVIVLPEVQARSIAIRKSFIDISVKRRKRMRKCLSAVGGWCAIGFPHCYTRPHESSTDAKRVTYIPSITLYSHITRRFEKHGFDFLRFNVKQAEMRGNIEAPPSYGGMSGGGVWKVCILRDVNTSTYSVDVEGTNLAGVAFYQTLPKGKPERLVCHGWKSIYGNVYRKLSRAAPGLSGGRR